ncbi:hypothetical protein P280DRAFT_39539 [Massarina eburnea CBS 473.64]|uniref:Uncharacterized protein n=1 Tax=Massarina eburnea CBS 473.64 TaxID=1395130 RepID=A0A6A6RYM0_9PLEO|nr:hypothetical protein P280DRAFT_39539 [Massarina eburnea CBS 473.64]
MGTWKRHQTIMASLGGVAILVFFYFIYRTILRFCPPTPRHVHQAWLYNPEIPHISLSLDRPIPRNHIWFNSATSALQRGPMKPLGTSRRNIMRVETTILESLKNFFLACSRIFCWKPRSPPFTEPARRTIPDDPENGLLELRETSSSNSKGRKWEFVREPDGMLGPRIALTKEKTIWSKFRNAK